MCGQGLVWGQSVDKNIWVFLATDTSGVHRIKECRGWFQELTSDKDVCGCVTVMK